MFESSNRLRYFPFLFIVNTDLKKKNWLLQMCQDKPGIDMVTVENNLRLILFYYAIMLDYCQYFNIHNNNSYFLLKLLVVAVVFLCEIEAQWLVGKNGDDENCPKRSKEFILDSFWRVYNNKLNLLQGPYVGVASNSLFALFCRLR